MLKIEILNKIQERLTLIVVLAYIVSIPVININQKVWDRNEGVITWDVKSYYSFLPATFIYKDLSFDYLDENKSLKKWVWPVYRPDGKKLIVTSVGLSYMYGPFFFMAHAYTKIDSTYQSDGYSKPYHIALAFSTYFYFILGLFLLRKILQKYFKEFVVAATLMAIGFGTNLLYYVTDNATMPHGYNFFLIVAFVYFLEKWWEHSNIKRTILLGLIGGLIVLIRPTNIVVLLLIPLWRVGSFKDMQQNVIKLLKNWHLILLMAFFFLLIWTPQFAYWKFISGKFIYYSYGEKNANFFFSNPQIWNVLFSYKKGWFLYTPIMFIASLGIVFTFNKKYKLGFAIIAYWALIIYAISSWWCWWFGGSFGQRSMIDFYGLMAIPLAAFIHYFSDKKWWLKIASIGLIFLLTSHNLFSIQQYRNQALHFWWMNKEAYWSNFLKLKPSCKYWQVIMIPDYDKARQGIYEWKPSHNKNRAIDDKKLKNFIIKSNQKNSVLIDSLKTIDKFTNLNHEQILNKYASNIIKNKEAEVYYNAMKIKYYTTFISGCASWMKELKKEAKRQNIPVKEMVRIEAERVYNSYGKKYVKE